MAKISRTVQEYIMAHVPYNYEQYILQQESLLISSAIQRYMGDERVLCFLYLSRIKSSKGSIIRSIHKNQGRNYGSLTEYFQKLITEDDFDDEVQLDSKTSADIFASDAQYGADLEQLTTALRYKTINPDDREIDYSSYDNSGAGHKAVNSVVNKYISLLFKCDVSTQRFVAVVKDGNDQFMDIKNTVWHIIESYIQGANSKDELVENLPKSAGQFIDQYCDSVTVVYKIPRKQKRSGANKSKSYGKQLPTYQKTDIKYKKKNITLFCNVVGDRIKFILVQKNNIALGVVLPQQYKTSNLSSILEVDETKLQGEKLEKYNSLIQQFLNIELKKLIENKQAKIFNNNTGYTETIKTIRSNNKENIQFILLRLDLAINQLF